MTIVLVEVILLEDLKFPVQSHIRSSFGDDHELVDGLLQLLGCIEYHIECLVRFHPYGLHAVNLELFWLVLFWSWQM